MSEKVPQSKQKQTLGSAPPPAINYGNISAQKKRRAKKAEFSGKDLGIDNDKTIEAEPTRISAPAEKVFRKGNSWIVLGRDRPRGRRTGYGATGDHRAAAIDICAGPQGYEISEWDSESGKSLSIDPDFEKDSARIYISAKTDLDKNFNLLNSHLPGPHTKMSGIGIKADGIRIIGRRGIRLSTGGDLRDSQGGIVDTYSGIDLVHGNNDYDLQPIVKSHNLELALEQLADRINEIGSILVKYLQYQQKYNKAIMNHYHYSPFFGNPTTPAIDTLVPAGAQVMLEHTANILTDLKNNKWNLINWKGQFLNKEASKNYIGSHRHRCT